VKDDILVSLQGWLEASLAYHQQVRDHGPFTRATRALVEAIYAAAPDDLPAARVVWQIFVVADALTGDYEANDVEARLDVEWDVHHLLAHLYDHPVPADVKPAGVVGLVFEVQ
jgi:hypothetical protein